ncbi:hypothetical protein GCM10022237_39620 [Nocardioides ginsengisoli]|uniref:Uncharacterized protein n=1 Tax=Kribbella ginsengisoli TaxID=363865 RepID=A0ABP6Z8E4_9ACTN
MSTWDEPLETAARELNTTVDDLVAVGLEWLVDVCAPIPGNQSPANVAEYIDHHHDGDWAGFLTDPYLNDGLAALAIERASGSHTVAAAAELLRVDLVDVVSVIADWALAAPQPRTLGVWDGEVIGNAGLRMLHQELINRGPVPSKLQLAAARSWVDHCDFPDVAGIGLSAEALSDDEIRDGLAATYHGGWLQFLADQIPMTLPRENTKTSNHESGEF